MLAGSVATPQPILDQVTALVQLAPAPRVLPYVVLAVLLAVAFVGALVMPEPVARSGKPRLTRVK